MKLVIGCDHTAVALKQQIIQHLNSSGIEVEDMGTQSTESSNYPEIAGDVCIAIQSGRFPLGILICGTGIGVSIVANKHKGIRCAVCSEPYSAMLSRQHNDANVLAFGARVVGPELAKMIVDAWLDATFMGERHQTRVDMINALDES